MAKTPSRKPRETARASSKIRPPKHPKTHLTPPKTAKNAPREQKSPQKPSFRTKIQSLKSKFSTFRSQHVCPHRSFRRSYREDYLRRTNTPGLLSHAVLTFKSIFSHWRTFLPFILLMVFFYIILVGLMSEEFYQQFQSAIDASSEELDMGKLGNFTKAGFILLQTVTTGGLSAGKDDAQMLFTIALFLIMWLVAIFLFRHYRAGHHPKLRDALYNALTPLLSTFVIFVVIFIEAIPLMFVIITYSAAVMTGFLTTPFYALVYFIFAALMTLLSAYLLSSSLMALVAVTAPGMYPLPALIAVSDLMSGRRIKFILRLLYLIFVIALIFVITMMPVIVLDLFLKSWFSWMSGWPIVPFCLLLVTCFAFIYAASYLYTYYSWLIDCKE